MKQLSFFIIITFILSINLHAQQTCGDWAYKIESLNISYQNYAGISSVCSDNAGNVYTTGDFQGTVDFNQSNTAIFNLVANNLYYYTTFLTKSDSFGNFIWAKSFVMQYGNSSVKKVMIDGSGNIYLVGTFFGIMDCDPGPSTYNLTSTLYSVFMIKLNSTGNFIWANKVALYANDALADALVDGAGNLYLTGYVNGLVDFDPSGAAWFNVGSLDHCFIAKYNSSGDYVWAKVVTDDYFAGQSDGISVSMDASNNLIISGTFSGVQDFDLDPSAGSTQSLTAVDSNNIFILKLSSSGSFIWVKHLFGQGDYQLVESDIDNLGNIFLTGSFDSTFDFNPSTNSYYYLYATSTSNFILKLNKDGIFKWAKKIGSGVSYRSVVGNSIQLDDQGNSYTLSKIFSTQPGPSTPMDFDPGPSTHYYTPEDNELFILNLDSSGDFSGVNHFRSGYIYGFCTMYIDAQENLYFAGGFEDSIRINNTILFNTLGFHSEFVAKIKFLVPPKNTSAGAALSTCSGNATTLTASGVGTLGWYSAPIGGTYLGGGNTFTTPILTSNTTYYVQDSICEASDRIPITVTVNSNALPTISVSASSSAFCKGLLATLTASGSNIYTWMPGNLTGSSVNVIPTTTTTYTVTGSNLFTGCYNTNTKTITVYQPPTSLSIASASGSICNGESITLSKLSSGVAVTNYVWSTGTANTPLTITPSSTTTYTVTASTSNGCSKTATKTIIVNSCSLAYTVKLFIEGYYLGAGLMRPVLMNQGVSGANANKTDSVRLSLRSTVDPYEAIYSWNTVLQTNGNITKNFPSLGTYYISVQHRNGLETWSKNPVIISTFNPNYNFTTAANKAYGDNMVEVETGKWAIYSGDINGDRNIDLLDLSDLEIDINNFLFGYFATDINGDGNVDLLDATPVESNVNSFVFSIQP